MFHLHLKWAVILNGQRWLVHTFTIFKKMSKVPFKLNPACYGLQYNFKEIKYSIISKKLNELWKKSGESNEGQTVTCLDFAYSLNFLENQWQTNQLAFSALN